MKKKTAIVLAVLVGLLLAPAAGAAGDQPQLEHVNINLHNRPALQRGARDFANYCLSCHQAKYMRYKQLEPGLGLTDKQIEDNLIFTGAKIWDPMTVAMTRKDAANWFGKAPPDLSDEVRIRGADWVYTYIKSFYLDPSQKTGVNNAVFPKVAMPDVFWHLQGLQKPVYKTVTDSDGTKEKVIDHLKLVKKGSLTPKQFDRFDRDLVTFLTYVSRPEKMESARLGAWVIGFLIFFAALAWLLKREYWKSIDH
ncbi:MAG TPA: cytochrome c1 [Gammaproteobacteria bacterium]|nr:cytochrome c1 [Gammaproteobacteria bacterium]